MRIEIASKSREIDGRGLRVARGIQEHVSKAVKAVSMVDVFLVDGVPALSKELAQEIFTDMVAQDSYIDSSVLDTELCSGWTCAMEVGYKAGVTDPEAITAREAIEAALGTHVPANAVIQAARLYVLYADALSQDEEKNILEYLHNNLIQSGTVIDRKDYDKGERFPSIYPHTIAPSSLEVEMFDIANFSDDELVTFSTDRLLALTLEEMQVIRNYYADPATIADRKSKGLSPLATDVELEMLAQTWSEHCKHKIFAAQIEYTDADAGNTTEKIDGVFKSYIKKTTDDLMPQRPDLKSVFHDNSGVVDFDDDHLICFKAETHNSPSALDPYGGAITGIVGVNRDILGTGIGAKPICNTNVLCFGELDTKAEDIPEGLLHPKQVMAGVHSGIVDGGNHSGIPVVGGAFLFDKSFTGKPLVFCGTGGILPREVNGRPSWEKRIEPGDLAVMVGGRIGKDGIHGATFSSLALDETSPTSAVQIGDPITQKKMIDFLLEARDADFYKGLTDNGAGGLSSSLGEMAEYSNGIRVDLHKAPLKYPGLAPWEIWVSESQERMSMAVGKDQIDDFLALAEKREVEATVVGEFTDNGYVELCHEAGTVGLLSMQFVHDGLPKMQLKAKWNKPANNAKTASDSRDIKADLLGLLAEPNIASKEDYIRQYDHEVQGGSVVKPFVGVDCDAPSDGAVYRPVPGSEKGFTVTHGICSRYSELDTYDMTMCAVDEAYRAHIALGGDPELASALDNYCWPDPVESEKTPDGQYKLAQLVRSGKGLQEICMAYNVPLISGKDSMKNDANLGGKKVSVLPTLLVSMIGIVPDVKKATTTDFQKAGDKIYVIGETRKELGASYFEKLYGGTGTNVPSVKPAEAKAMYVDFAKAIQNELVASCHDISDGGLAVAIAESAIGGGIGAKVSVDNLAVSEEMAEYEKLFSETASRFVVSISPENEAAFLKTMDAHKVSLIGEVTAGTTIEIGATSVAVADAKAAFKTLVKGVH